MTIRVVRRSGVMPVVVAGFGRSDEVGLEEALEQFRHVAVHTG